MRVCICCRKVLKGITANQKYCNNCSLFLKRIKGELQRLKIQYKRMKQRQEQYKAIIQPSKNKRNQSENKEVKEQ